MKDNEHITILCPPGTERIAEKLERELSRYRVPRDVSKRTGVRDVSGIKEDWLIVVCTPETPADPVIGDKIGRSVSRGQFSHILTCLYSDRPDLSFPSQLLTEVRPDGTTAVHEPLAADIFAPTEKESLKKLRTEKLRLLAPMLGVAFDDLLDRRRRARTRALAAVGAAVFLGGALFLGSTLTRKNTLEKQNRELNALYREADAAREEAERQRTKAREEDLKTAVLSALRDADNGDTEAALEKCLSLAREKDTVPEAAEALERVLEIYCAGGYIPIGSAYDYRLTRGLTPDREDVYHRSDDLYAEKDYHITVPPPEDLDTKDKMITMDLCARSPSGRVRVYAYGNGALMRVCFETEPERDHYLRDAAGEILTFDGLERVTRDGVVGHVNACCLAGEEKLLFLKDRTLWTADLESGQIRPADREGERDCRLLLDFPDTDAVFVFGETGAEVWDRETLELLLTIEGLEDIVARGDCGVLLGWRDGSLEVYRKDPFEYMYTVKRDDVPEENALGSDIDTMYLPNGCAVLMYRYVLYDLENGGVILDLRDESTRSPRISLEGWVLTGGFQSVSILDPVSGRRLMSVCICLADGLGDAPDFQPYGPTDPGTGRRGVSAVRVGDRVYEYRSPRELPASAEERAALAEEILSDREIAPAVVFPQP